MERKKTWKKKVDYLSLSLEPLHLHLHPFTPPPSFLQIMIMICSLYVKQTSDGSGGNMVYNIYIIYNMWKEDGRPLFLFLPSSSSSPLPPLLFRSLSKPNQGLKEGHTFVWGYFPFPSLPCSKTFLPLKLIVLRAVADLSSDERKVCLLESSSFLRFHCLCVSQINSNFFSTNKIWQMEHFLLHIFLSISFEQQKSKWSCHQRLVSFFSEPNVPSSTSESVLKLMLFISCTKKCFVFFSLLSLPFPAPLSHCVLLQIFVLVMFQTDDHLFSKVTKSFVTKRSNKTLFLCCTSYLSLSLFTLLFQMMILTRKWRHDVHRDILLAM